MPGIGDAVGEVDEGDVAVVPEVVREAVPLAARVEAQEGELREEQAAPGAFPDIELDAVEIPPAGIVVANGRAAPIPAVLDRRVGLAGPARVVEAPGDRMGRGGLGGTGWVGEAMASR